MHTQRLMITFAIAVLCTFSSLVLAGSRYTSQVYVNDTYRSASGSMTDARGSADTQQFIGCYHYYDTLSTTPYQGFCQASTANGLSRSCSTNNSQVVQSIRSISSESNISFAWNTDGTCRYVLVNNNSNYKPASAAGF